MKEKGFKFKDSPLMTLKTSRIPFLPKTPHNAMRHSVPKSYVSMSAEITLPSCKHINIGITHWSPNKRNVIVSSSKAIGQKRRKWSMDTDLNSTTVEMRISWFKFKEIWQGYIITLKCFSIMLFSIKECLIL